MTTETFEGVATGSITQQLDELYQVCLELATLKLMLDELEVGPRGVNEVFAITSVRNRMKALKAERAAIRRLIREMPKARTLPLFPKIDAGN